MKRKLKLKIKVLFLSIIFCVTAFHINVKAASGNIYSCEIARTYEHPVTGKVEDSGGNASKATGQGMVESVIASKGLLEVSEDKEYYLTFRMSLIDQTSNYQFAVQKKGESQFHTQSVTQTNTGKDSNGTTKDFRIRLSSENSIVRCSMYVKPMGRNVIFYFYPGNYTAGNSVGMKNKIVTEDLKDQKASKQQNTETKTTTKSQEVTQTQSSTAQKEDETLNNAQGLSLSTAPKTTTKKSTSSEKSVGTWIMILTISMTLSGLILLGVAAVIVYYYRKNWKRWGGDQDEYDEIYKDEN